MSSLPESLHPVQLSRILRDDGHDVTVTDVSAEPVGTGQMAASFRIRLTFDGPSGDLPSTLVAKTAIGPVERRQIASGSYRTEVDFYRQIAPRTTLRIPHCWASWMTEDAHEFVLLLEDLAPRRQGDQLIGCRPDQARAAAINLAGLHGPLWNDPWLTEVLPAFGPEQIPDFDAAFPVMIDLFLDRYGARLSDSARALYGRIGSMAGTWLAGRPEPFGVVHGDYRLDNLMFSDDGADVVALDWQTTSLGLPGRDLAFLLGTGLAVEDRRAHEDEIIAAYHGALVDQGVTGQDLDACRDDYVYGMLQAPLVIVFGSAIAEASDRGDEMFLAMTERSAAAIDDLGTLEKIDAVSSRSSS